MENSGGGGCGALSNNTLALEVTRGLHLFTLPPGVQSLVMSVIYIRAQPRFVYSSLTLHFKHPLHF